ncbi:MAG: flagellar basal body-associated FliL family protein [Sphingomonadaceae bacterium]|nr:flagellar basal body-associated FliL family protein [Sphingomonadaceae bacterium]
MSSPDPAAAAAAPEPARKRGIARKLVPAILVLVAAGGGAAAMHFLAPRLGAAPVHAKPAPDPLRYERLEGAFTTNLAGSQRLIQVELGVAVAGGEPAVTGLHALELPLRSAVLEVLGQQGETAVATPAGRAALQRQLRAAMNRVTSARGAGTPVESVYFTSWVIQ